MTADTRELESWLVDLADRLAAEYADVLTADVVTATALAAKQDLTGQIAPEAQGEMVYHLARYRLDRRTSAPKEGR